MSKLKKMLAVISTVSLLSVSTGSIASSNLDQKSLDSTPAFLQNTGAVMMTDGQMVEVQGEAIWIPIMAGIAIANLLMAHYIFINGKTAQDRANAWSYIENHPGWIS